MNTKFQQGDKFNIEYPFYNQDCGEWNGEKQSILTPGCHRSVSDDDCGYGSYETVEWYANYTGEISYEIMSIAKMPGRYMDRVIVKYHYILPCGDIYGRSQMKTLTIGKLKNQIENNKVFPCDYYIEENF